MQHRTELSELEWNDKTVDQTSRDELIELCEVLHSMVWRSAENFEALLKKQWDVRGTA